MSDPLSFLSSPTAVEPEVVSTPEPEAEAPVVEQAAEGPARGPDGKFAPKAPSAPESVETAPVAAETPAAEQHAPISALLDERDKRKAAQDRAEALEKQLAEYKARTEAPQEPLPPDQAMQQQLFALNMRNSRRFAEREYGKQIIETVHDWAAKRCDQDKTFNQQMFASDDPYEVAYQAYNRAQLEPLIAGVKPDDFAAFKAWQAAQAAMPPPQAPQTPASSPPPPRSLANAPGNGAAGTPFVDTRPGAAFDSVIPR